MGEKAIREANSYVLRAERKMGEMLKETELQKPGEHWKKKRLPRDTVIPTLSELGLTKKRKLRGSDNS